jgi:surface antigen-like variable number repeat protein/TonB-like protein
MIGRLTCGALLVMLAGFTAPAQVKTDQKCSSPIYTAREVTKRAKITERPNLSAVPRDVRGRAVLEAVLCRTGQVTDIQVIEGLSATVNEFAAAAVSLVRFVPAELNLHSVSQRIQFDFRFSELGAKGMEVTDAAGRFVEELDTIGNRRLTPKEVRSWIKTRPGDNFNTEQIKKDLDALLATGYFDKPYTRVYSEEAARGGVRVVFEVKELPLIFEVKFVGLNKSEQSSIDEALREGKVNLRSGAPFDAVQGKMASRIIKHFLESKRRLDVNVDLRVENLAAEKVSLTFIVTNQ